MLLLYAPFPAPGQEQPSFVDGFHGGVEGHYPSGTTQFIVDTLTRHPDWKICLEIEPATWRAQKISEPEAFRRLEHLLAKSPDRVEFVSGAYGQPFFWNMDGESLIRHFTFGIAELHKSFPKARVTTYACEEPCWTSAMPQILNSLGFARAVLKNPLTCWGGACAGKDAELLNWIGPDGSSIPAVPRYAVETDTGNCWETQAAYNTREYILAARAAGIAQPVGMSFQDAGWKSGRRPLHVPSVYRTWREYFERVAGPPSSNWAISQEDFQVSLMWGAQVLQRIAQDVRSAETKLVATEKIAAMAGLSAPEADLRKAWISLLLSQHHDCWIVPYNRHSGGTWATQVSEVWIPDTLRRCQQIVNQSLHKLAAGQGPGPAQGFVRVVNSISADRHDVVALPWDARPARVFDGLNREVPCQTSAQQLLFAAAVPSLGYSTYRVEPAAQTTAFTGARASRTGALVTIETDLYRIVMDADKGGCVKSLYDKALRLEFVEAGGPRRFNEYRGYSDSAGDWISSAEAPATIQVVENGPVRVVVTASGMIGEHPFVSTLTAVQGQRRIDLSVRIQWQGQPLIGQAWEGGSVRTSMDKPFYDDRYKLQAVFPCALSGPVTLNKNAAFDVCQSRNRDTFFNNWREIKHNIITHWVDINDAAGAFGFALMSDHTTSYAFGPDDPLGLVLAYAGKGLWNKNYSMAGPTEVRYAILPHAGTWAQAGLWREDSQWRESLLAQWMTGSPSGQPAANSFVRTAPGTYVTTILMDKSDLLVRLFNAEGDSRPQTVGLGFVPVSAKWVELDGRVIAPLQVVPGAGSAASVTVSIPRFGVRTLRLSAGKGALAPALLPREGTLGVKRDLTP